MRLLGRYLNLKTEVQAIFDLCQRAVSSRVQRDSPTSVRGPARLTQQQNDIIVSLYKEGRRAVAIAREVGTTEWTVHHRLNRLGVERRPSGLTPSQLKEAVRLHDDGVPITVLVKRYGRSWKTIDKELRLARGH